MFCSISKRRDRKKKLTVNEFADVCRNVFSTENVNGRIKVEIKIPKGCGDCQSAALFNQGKLKKTAFDFDCENCGWKNNYWKYVELTNIMHLQQMKSGGFDLNRIKTLEMADFIKVAVIDKYVRN